MEDRKTAVETLHRERIMDASERLFLEKGFQGTTISDISEAADYSRRTIYAYFESKDEILCGVVARGLRMLRDELRAVLGEKLTFSEMYDSKASRRSLPAHCSTASSRSLMSKGVRSDPSFS